MKLFVLSLIAFMVCISVCDADQLSAKELLIYREPPGTYTEAFEISMLVHQSSLVSTAIFPDGQRYQCKNAGILAQIEFPPERIPYGFEQEAAFKVQSVDTLIQRFPKLKGKLLSAKTRWESALALAKQLDATQQAQNPSAARDTLSFTTTDGRKFDKVTLSGTSGTGISITTDSGIEHIAYERLSKDFQKRFHYEPPKVMTPANPTSGALQAKSSEDTASCNLQQPTNPFKDKLFNENAGGPAPKDWPKAGLGISLSTLGKVLEENGYAKRDLPPLNGMPRFHFRNPKLDLEFVLYGTEDLVEVNLGMQQGRLGNESAAEAYAHIRDITELIAPSAGLWLISSMREQLLDHSMPIPKGGRNFGKSRVEFSMLPSNTPGKFSGVEATIISIADSAKSVGDDKTISAPKDTDAIKSQIANEESAEGQYALGLRYLRGEGVTKDEAEATKWFQKAAKMGLSQAQFIFGLSYAIGSGGLTKDQTEAAKWFRKAADQGNSDGQWALGMHYVTTANDYVEAVKWFRMAAEQGNANAEYFLALCYYQGKGIPENKVKGAVWMIKAASDGDPNAKKIMETSKQSLNNNY